MLKNTKRLFVGTLVAIMLVSIFAMQSSAAEKVLFSDDFSANSFDKWTNTYIEPDSYDYPNSDDSYSRVKNGELVCNSFDAVGTFSFVGAKNLKAKDFVFSAKLKVNRWRLASQGDGGWVGIHFRKATQDRFNVTEHGMLLFLRLNSNRTITAECGAMRADSSTWLRRQIRGVYNGDVSGWLDWRVEVVDSVFKVYVNDQLIEQFEYKAIKDAGYFSLNHCVFDGSIDNVKVTEYQQPTTTTAGTTGNTTGDSGGSVITLPNGNNNNKTTTTSSTTVTGGNNNDSTTTSQVTTPTTVVSEQVQPIQPLYTDISVDNVFYVIPMQRQLTVADFLGSFQLADGYSLELRDLDGNVITDSTEIVTVDMKATLLLDGFDYAAYTIRLDYDAVDTNDVNVKPATEFSGWMIALIIVGAVLVVAGAVLIIVFVAKNKKKAA